MKKVNKIVLNSVSHDARVLKEAEAIKNDGFDVTIIGIQDANNNVPIEIMDNGVVIRRVAWQADAFKPHLTEYVALMMGVVLVALVTLYYSLVVFNSLLEFKMPSEFYSLSEIVSVLFPLISFSIVYYIYTKLRGKYKRKKASYNSLKKSQDDESLKYSSVYNKYYANTKSKIQLGVNEEVKAGVVSMKKQPEASKVVNKKTLRPRPFMRGWLNAFRIKEINRWNVVFAREKCIAKILEEEVPDIVHAHDLAALPVASKYSKKTGVTLVFDAHEIYDHLAQAESDTAELNSLILEKYAKQVDKFITINKSISNYYRENYPDLPTALIIKNATIPAEEVEYDGRLHDAAGIDHSRKIVLYQGGFAAKRGLIQLLMSAEYLDPEWCLVYMGWGNLEDELHRVADALIYKNPSLASRVRFVPKVKQSELPYWSSGAALGVIPYENTGLNHWFCNPNKLWEYPNAGVPIIASPFPEMSKIIDKHQIGFYLPDPLNPKEIATSINELDLNDLNISRNNCKTFIERDNWNVYSNKLVLLYREFR